MKTILLSSIRLTLICLVVFSGAYTLLIFGIAQMAPGSGKGELVKSNGKTYYSNVGQAFTSEKYFNSRPSAVSYNAAGSGGSNKGPSNPDYLKEVSARIDTFLMENPQVRRNEVPSDLVTASGSGLDPHISPEAAYVQVQRVASVRKVDAAQIEQLVGNHIEEPLLGIFGTRRVNVLKLNIALDNL